MTTTESTGLPAPISNVLDLPFVADVRERGRKVRCFWRIEEPAADYNEACARGAEFAAAYAASLQTLDLGNLLGQIAKAIDYRDPAVSGYWVGFTHAIEQLLRTMGRENDLVEIILGRAQTDRAATEAGLALIGGGR